MNRHNVLGWSGALVASALMVAACGSSTGSTPAASQGGNATSAQTTASGATTSIATGGGSAVDACSLITEQESTAALGGDPGPGKARGTKGNSCSYSLSNGRDLEIAFSPTNGSRSQFDATKAQVAPPYQQQGGTVQDLTGVGDAAFVVATGHGGACAILKGTNSVVVSVFSGTVLTAPADILTTLCRAAAGRL